MTKEPDELATMLRLRELVAGELGCSHMMVRRYVAAGGWMPARLRRHRGNPTWCARIRHGSTG